ncbi:MAG: hypothetical protein IPN90_10745 [Elusimicrobia bacterium]|nr:hypothetical protein [Elusimicrobiota bacterium]
MDQDEMSSPALRQMEGRADAVGEEEMADKMNMRRFEEKSKEAHVPAAFAMSKLGGGGAMETPASMTAGILPVRVNVPTVGNSVTYTKTLPEPNSLLTLPLYHVATWVRTMGGIIAFVILALIAWTLRRAFKWNRLEGAKP